MGNFNNNSAKRPLDGALQIEAQLRCYLRYRHKILSIQNQHFSYQFTFNNYQNNDEVFQRVR